MNFGQWPEVRAPSTSFEYRVLGALRITNVHMLVSLKIGILLLYGLLIIVKFL